MADNEDRADDEAIHYEGGIPVFNGRLNKLEDEARKAKDRDDKYKSEQLELNRRLVWFTGLLAVVGLVGSVISGYQAHVSKINADAAKDNAAAAKGMVEEMKNSRAQASSDNARAVAAQERIAQSSLETSQRNFKSSAAMGENTFRDEQRAWVGVESLGDLQIDAANPTDPYKLNIGFFNSGKTPALHVHDSNRYRFYSARIDSPYPADLASVTSSFVTETAMPPQGRQTLYITDNSLNPIRIHWMQLTAGREFLYIFGEYRYDDVSGRTHATEFCAMLDDPKTKKMVFCKGFNEMD